MDEEEFDWVVYMADDLEQSMTLSSLDHETAQDAAEYAGGLWIEENYEGGERDEIDVIVNGEFIRVEAWIDYEPVFSFYAEPTKPSEWQQKDWEEFNEERK